MLRGDIITGLQKIASIEGPFENGMIRITQEAMDYIREVAGAAADELSCGVVEMPPYDQEEIHHNCTVQVLKNSITGETSVGWWKND